MDELTAMVQNLSLEANGSSNSGSGRDENDCCKHMKSILEQKLEECEKLRAENDVLKQNTSYKGDSSDSDDLSENDSDDSDGCEIVNPKPSHKASQPNGHLLIGDSLLRDIIPIENNIKIACMQGAKFHDVLKKLRTETKQYESITVVCGTNNISTKKNIEDITEDAEKLVLAAKLKSKNVTLSSIPPRIDSAVTDQRLRSMNERLEVTCQAHDVNFINLDRNFKFLNEIPDESLLLADGLHLSAAGVNRLIRNLKLNKSVECRLKQIPSHFKTKDTDVNQYKDAVNSNDKRRRKPSTKTRNGITVFFGKDSVFSNLYMSAPIVIDGQKFSCNEQYYTHALATFFHDESTANKALATDDPYELVDLHKKAANYDRNKWLPEAEKVLYMANLAKYSQNSSARSALLETQDNLIGEASYSRKWGIGIPIQDKNAMNHHCWTGKNIMGKILMKIRDALKNENDNERRSTPETNYYHDKHYSNDKMCWFCGEQNHLSQNCKHGHELQCNYCYQYGHKAKFCKSY